MKYICLIYADETQIPVPDSPAFSQMMSAYEAFNDEVRAAGVLVAGEPLEDTPTASTVSVRGGERIVTDGPFAETKEQLGGFYILDCRDLDEALDYAAKIPTATVGRVEVRPLMVLPGA
tara:strand:- start:97 stop:453 length:357 start_codon:yes stop_codon:yes gene_type:complete